METNLWTCRICGKAFKRLTVSHLKTHNTSFTNYREKYPNTPTNQPCTYRSERTKWCCPNPIYEKYGSKFCILHEPSSDKDVETFNSALESFIIAYENDPTTVPLPLGAIWFPNDFSL